MEVEVISRDTIKPSSPTPPHLQTFKISFIDKIMPIGYIPFISFFPCKRNNSNFNHILFTNHLKRALAEALTRFYPLAGRIKDDLTIDCNDKGLLFVTTLVNCDMSQLLAKAQPKIELFNQLALVWPEPDGEEGHQIGIQLNILSCGGFALYICFCHKIIDATTISAFMKCWGAISSGCSSTKALHPDFPAALLFPLRKEPGLELMPCDLRKYWNVKWLLRDGNGTVKRFVFEAGSISRLKDKARSERVPNPTRVEAVSSFIWKCCMDASTKVWESQQPSTLTQMVDLRRRMAPPLSEFSVGNIIWKTVAHYDTMVDEEVGVEGLAALLRQAVNKLREEFVPKVQTISKCEKAIQEFLEEEKDRYDNSKQLINPYEFTSWINMGLNQVNFGWGKPIWVSLIGMKEVPSVYKNSIYLMEGETSDKIEAWLMLGHAEMAVLECDPEFLAFADLIRLFASSKEKHATKFNAIHMYDVFICNNFSKI